MKETKKQIKAQLINEVRRSFEDKLTRKDEVITDLRHNYEGACKELRLIHAELSEVRSAKEDLEVKIKQYEDWIARMQDFCNLPEAERGPALRQYLDNLKTDSEHKQKMSEIFDFVNRYMHFL